MYNQTSMEEKLPRNRGTAHYKWVDAILSRDLETCQHCGIKGVEMHAHHIKSYKHHPELRYDFSNGITLCFSCHWKVHAKPANPVNSVKTLTGGAEGNTEPSGVRNYAEGVTDRGRAYRRWNGHCEWCAKFISKRLSDTTGKKHLFCSRECATRHLAANRTEQHRLNISKANSGKRPSAETRLKMSAAQHRRQANAKAVISSKSAGRESDELS